VAHVRNTATPLRPVCGQRERFAAKNGRALERFSAIDRINLRCGEFTVAPAPLLEWSTMPHVIALRARAGTGNASGADRVG